MNQQAQGKHSELPKIKTNLIQLTDSREKHDTEASEYWKLVSYSGGTQRIKADVTFVS